MLLARIVARGQPGERGWENPKLQARPAAPGFFMHRIGCNQIRPIGVEDEGRRLALRTRGNVGGRQ
jgi:hypothetical protein